MAKTRAKALAEGVSFLEKMRSSGWSLRVIRKRSWAAADAEEFRPQLVADPFRINVANSGKFYCTIGGTLFGYTSDAFDDPNEAYDRAVKHLHWIERRIQETLEAIPKAKRLATAE